jgi:hypothetical protein
VNFLAYMVLSSQTLRPGQSQFSWTTTEKRILKKITKSGSKSIKLGRIYPAHATTDIFAKLMDNGYRVQLFVTRKRRLRTSNRPHHATDMGIFVRLMVSGSPRTMSEMANVQNPRTKHHQHAIKMVISVKLIENGFLEPRSATTLLQK